MTFHTDLTIGVTKTIAHPFPDISQTEEQHDSYKVTHIHVEGPEGAKQLNKEVGNYVTLEVPPILDTVDLEDRCQRLLREKISALLPEEGLVLVTGLGNRQITPDTFGPQTTARVFATRHVKGEPVRVTGPTGLRGAAVITPGVLSDTGLETMELLQGVRKQLHPSAVVVIDALAARNLVRLGRTAQLSDTSIPPGRGVENLRPCIDRHTMSVPVIGTGVPAVVDVETLVLSLSEGDCIRTKQSEEKLTPCGACMVATPREIDLLVSRVAQMLAMGINHALNPSLSVEDLTILTTP